MALAVSIIHIVVVVIYMVFRIVTIAIGLSEDTIQLYRNVGKTITSAVMAVLWIIAAVQLGKQMGKYSADDQASRKFSDDDAKEAARITFEGIAIFTIILSFIIGVVWVRMLAICSVKADVSDCFAFRSVSLFPLRGNCIGV